MNPDNNSAALREAFAAMQQQVQAAHREWIGKLAELYPNLADVLWRYHDYYCRKHEHTEALPLLLTLNPSLPLENLLRQYGTELDAYIAGDDSEGKEAGACTDNLGPHQRAGLTKRRRTRESLIVAAVELMIDGKPFRIDDVVRIAGVSEPTFYGHFRSRGELLKAAYERLFMPALSTGHVRED